MERAYAEARDKTLRGVFSCVIAAAEATRDSRGPRSRLTHMGMKRRPHSEGWFSRQDTRWLYSSQSHLRMRQQ